MPASVSAGVEFGFSSVRYAEVQVSGGSFRLLRLGQCDFDFDVTQSLVDESADEERAAISQALKEALADSEIKTLRAVLHPPICRSFFSHALPDTDPMDQVSHEARVLGFVDGPSVDGVAADAASGRDGLERLHVTSINPAILERLGGVVDILGAEDAQAVSGIRAAVEVARLSPGGDQLVLGRFSGCYEAAVIRRGEWIFAHHGTEMTDPSDMVYQIASGLSALGEPLASFPRVHTYGSHGFGSTLRALFGQRIRPLRPLPLVMFDPDSLDPEYDAAEFVPALGASLL